jgi:hypothetical protein
MTARRPRRLEIERIRGRVFFTARYRAVYRGYRRYRWGTVTVPSGRNPPKFKFEFKFKKMKKSIKITKK